MPDKIAFIFKKGRKSRLSQNTSTGKFPSEFFYGYVQLKAQGHDVSIIDEFDLNLVNKSNKVVRAIDHLTYSYFGLHFKTILTLLSRKNLNTLNQDDPAQLFDAELNDLHQVKLFYSFNVGSIHVISLCSYCNYRPNSPQIKWLRDDLSSVKQPFIVVMTHVPLYHTNHAHHRASIHFINAFEQIFINGHVDLVLAGHVHAYERTHPLINGKVNTNGPMYIVIGDGGNREKLSNDWVLDKNEISAYKNGIDYGYGKLIANSTHVEWTWYKNNLKDMEASDRLVVKRRTVQNTDKK